MSFSILTADQDQKNKMAAAAILWKRQACISVEQFQAFELNLVRREMTSSTACLFAVTTFDEIQYGGGRRLQFSLKTHLGIGLR